MVNPTPDAQWSYCGPLRADDYRCDRCGATANTAHVVSADGDWPDETDRDLRVLFACPQHDAGGYWFELTDWWADDMRTHLLRDKSWGRWAVGAFYVREQQIRDAKPCTAPLAQRRNPAGFRSEEERLHEALEWMSGGLIPAHNGGVGVDAVEELQEFAAAVLAPDPPNRSDCPYCRNDSYRCAACARPAQGRAW